MTSKATIKIKSIKITAGDFLLFTIDAHVGTNKATAQIAVNKLSEIFHEELEAILVSATECLNEIMEGQEQL